MTEHLMLPKPTKADRKKTRRSRETVSSDLRFPTPMDEPLLHPDYKKFLHRQDCAVQTPPNGYKIEAAHMPRPRGRGRTCIPLNHVAHQRQEVTLGERVFVMENWEVLMTTLAELYIRIARLEGYDGPIYDDGSG